MTHRQILEMATQMLSKAGVTEASNDAFVLWQEVFGLNRTGYLINAEKEADKDLCPKYLMLINRRCTRMPLQYITGKAYFMGLEFKVSPAVLIPRFDTEILVEEVLKYVDKESTVLDMCTGSGCIGISLAALGKCTVTAVDISKEALEIAKRNAEINHTDYIKFVHSDMFENVTGTFDVIVSNPPYIPSKDCLELMPEVKEYEPMLALDGYEDGLFFYRILAEQAAQYLNPEGLLIVEIGYDQADAVKKLLDNNNFIGTRVIKDLAVHDRVVCGWRK